MFIQRIFPALFLPKVSSSGQHFRPTGGVRNSDYFSPRRLYLLLRRAPAQVFHLTNEAGSTSANNDFLPRRHPLSILACSAKKSPCAGAPLMQVRNSRKGMLAKEEIHGRNCYQRKECKKENGVRVGGHVPIFFTTKLLIKKEQSRKIFTIHYLLSLAPL